MTLHEIERAITELPQNEFVELRDWFLEFDAKVWDRQIEADAASGRLDILMEPSLLDYREGRFTEL